MLSITQLQILEYFRRSSGKPKGRYDVWLELPEMFPSADHMTSCVDRALSVLLQHGLIMVVSTSTKGSCRKYQITYSGFKLLKNIKQFVKEVENA